MGGGGMASASLSGGVTGTKSSGISPCLAAWAGVISCVGS